MNLLKRILLGSFVSLLVGCANVHTELRPTQYVEFTGKEAADLALIQKHCPFGKPKPDPYWNHGPTVEITRKGYALLHSSRDKIPLWVCEYITKAQLSGPYSRPDDEEAYFRPDPELPANARAEKADYRGSGFDRGHQAPAGDQTADEQLIQDTFFLSNMSPQVGAGFNRGIWKQLESQVRKWIKARGDGFVITGPMFYDSNEESHPTGFTRIKRIGTRKVAVPTHFFKIVVAKNTNTQKWVSIAFVFENRKYPKGYTLSPFEIRSIDWIEKRTGFDFMPDLLPEEEKRLERTSANLWN